MPLQIGRSLRVNHKPVCAIPSPTIHLISANFMSDISCRNPDPILSSLASKRSSIDTNLAFTPANLASKRSSIAANLASTPANLASISLRKSSISLLVAKSEDSCALRTTADIALAFDSSKPAFSSASNICSVSNAGSPIDRLLPPNSILNRFYMSGNTLGTLFTVTTFGESHGPAMGCVIDGCPPGLALNAADCAIDSQYRRAQSNGAIAAIVFSAAPDRKNPAQAMPVQSGRTCVRFPHLKPMRGWALPARRSIGNRAPLLPDAAHTSTPAPPAPDSESCRPGSPECRRAPGSAQYPHWIIRCAHSRRQRPFQP